MELNKIYQGDSLEVLKTFPNESIDCIITSPPYYGLRDYGIEGQIGQEKTPQEYITNLMKIMDECKRVLKKTGSLWVNIGDTYPSGGGKAIECSFVRNSKNSKDNKFSPDFPPKSKLRYSMGKSLLGIPERFVIAMYDNMWLRRNTIIWYKPNCMPSSVKDRFTVDFEYFYFFTKQKKYHFETQYEPLQQSTIDRDKYTRITKGKDGHYAVDHKHDSKSNGVSRIKRSVWKVTLQPFKGAHFAVFPEKLVETPIKACCPLEICDKCNKPRVRMEKILGYDKVNDWMISGGCDSNGEYKGTEIKDYKSAKAQMPSETKRRILKSMSKQTSFEYSKCNCDVGFHKGVVLDPFMGAGTVGVVAKKLGVDYVGIELNKDYVTMANNRINSIL